MPEQSLEFRLTYAGKDSEAGAGLLFFNVKPVPVLQAGQVPACDAQGGPAEGLSAQAILDSLDRVRGDVL